MEAFGAFGAFAFLILAVDKFVKGCGDMKSVVFDVAGVASDVVGLVKKYL